MDAKSVIKLVGILTDHYPPDSSEMGVVREVWDFLRQEKIDAVASLSVICEMAVLAETEFIDGRRNAVNTNLIENRCAQIIHRIIALRYPMFLEYICEHE